MRGMTRPVDSLGRIVIPKEIRRNFNLQPEDELKIEVVSAGILLSPVKAFCQLCGSTDDLLVVDGVGVCRGCAKALKEELEERGT